LQLLKGVLYDTYDCSGEGTVRIEGYWALSSSVESAAKRKSFILKFSK